MAVNWKETLISQMPPDWSAEIDTFEAQMKLRKAGKIEDKVFAETRLRRGAYGQRYDNGQRYDGKETQKLDFPSGELTKGPETMWDAPGMMRIKIPYGGLNPEQIRAIADCADEYSDGIGHVTTRQDIQLHYVHIEDAPDLMRRLAAVGITTREACGNAVRNITACPLSGVCRTETFDVTPYSKAMMRFLLGHPDTMDFGRKFKIAFSGCKHEACGLVSMHDLGGIAATRMVDGKEQRGFEIYVGGGLGAVPYQAKLLEEFISEEELLPWTQAVARLFGRMGEKKNRNRARIKFVVAKVGIEEFRKLVIEERKVLPHDPRWTEYLKDLHQTDEHPGQPAGALEGAPLPEGFSAWQTTNVYHQRQPGYVVATVTLPLGDLSTPQLRAVADLAHRYAGDHVRLTVEQNLVFRWVSEAELPALYTELKSLGLGQAGAGTIVDVVACPGTDTCKLGIASSRGLAGELRSQILDDKLQLHDAVKSLRIKISGCFNSCGQHHVADIGFYGNSRNVNGYTVPHFQVILGGKWVENAGSYGLAMGSVPSKRIPELIEKLTGRWVAERAGDETFQAWCLRLGKKALKAVIDEFTHVPPHDQDASYYTDWGDPREFTIGDMGTGECAGELVSLAQFGFTAAESSAFEAQLAHEARDFAKADRLAYQAMIEAAKTLVHVQWRDVPNMPESIATEFKTRFQDTGVFADRFAKDQFANYFFSRHTGGPVRLTDEDTHRLIEEANLFIDAAHKCYAKVSAQAQPVLLTVGAKA